MKNNLYIQKSQVSTLSKNPNGLFDLKKWATNLLTDYGVIAGDPCCVSGSTGVSGNISEARYSVFTGIQASGVTEVDATVLDYGVNLVEIAGSSNIAVKLPQPVTGKSTKIINMTLLPIYVFPSNVGGKINNLPVDTPQTIPADGKVYEFICTENPFPGNWNILSVPGSSSFTYQISVPHTQGVATFVVVDDSTGNIISGNTAYINNNGNNTFSLFPTSSAWKTFNTPTTSTYLKVYSNVISSDVPGGPGNNIEIDRRIVYMYETPLYPGSYATMTSVGQAIRFEDPTYGNDPYLMEVTNGPISGASIAIGDMGTLYCEQPQQFHFAGAGGAVLDQLGPVPASPDMKSNIYNIYKVYIPASAVTKTYDFLIVQEYM